MSNNVSRINVWSKRYKKKVNKQQEELDKEEAAVVEKLKKAAKMDSTVKEHKE